MTGHVTRLSLWIRLWHWMTALSFIVLTITGIVLHFGDPADALISYDTATTLHDVGGIFMAVLYGAHLVFMIGDGYWRNYIPAGENLWARLKAQVIFYTVGLGRNGSYAYPAADGRFNVLQQLAYLTVVFALLPLLIVTGLLYLYYPAFVPETVLGLAGLWPLALAHYALGILGAAYLIVHVYMATVGPNAGASLRLMTIGRIRSAQRRSQRRSALLETREGVHMAGPNENSIETNHLERHRMRARRRLGFAGTKFLLLLALFGASGGTGAGQEPATKEELMATGEQIYNDTCVGCHQVDGMGIPGIYPPLVAGAPFQAAEVWTRPLAARGFLKDGRIQLGSVESHIDVVVNGIPNTTMFGFRGVLSDEEIAAVVTYERNAWGNESGDVVQPAQIEAAR